MREAPVTDRSTNIPERLQLTSCSGPKGAGGGKVEALYCLAVSRYHVDEYSRVCVRVDGVQVVDW